jgi:hypothetical protein
MCPSHVEKIVKIFGRIPSFNARRRRGARSAKIFSREGTASTHLARRGSFSFKEFTSVNEDINATGMDQKKQRAVVAAKLKSLPVFRALDGSPTFRQKMSSGLGAGSTSILLAVNKKQVRGRICEMLAKIDNSPQALLG